MWGADAIRLQMGSGHHGKVLPSLPALPLPSSFFWGKKKEERKQEAGAQPQGTLRTHDPGRLTTLRGESDATIPWATL